MRKMDGQNTPKRLFIGKRSHLRCQTGDNPSISPADKRAFAGQTIKEIRIDQISGYVIAGLGVGGSMGVKRAELSVILI